MKIIKELHDNNKNVAIIIKLNEDEVDDYLCNDNEKLSNKCINYLKKNYFKKSETNNKIMNNRYDFTMRWVSNNHVLCYFNRKYNETFENKIIKTIIILNIDDYKIDNCPNEPLYLIKKYGLGIFTNDMITAPFVWKIIDMKDVVWSK